MPLAYLAEGVTSFAAANWSDATGFATNAQLSVKLIGNTIVSDLDQSAVATGINVFRVTKDSNGNIGTAAAGSVKFDADDVTTQWTSAVPGSARVELAQASGTVFIDADGGSNVHSNVFLYAGGTVNYTGGTLTRCAVDKGQVNINGSTVVTTAWFFGGTVTVLDNATGFTALDIYGGSHTIQRGATAINLHAGTLILDCDSRTVTTLNHHAGELIHVSGAVTTLNGYTGNYSPNLRKAATIGTVNRWLPYVLDKSDPMLTVTTDVRNHPDARV